MTTAKMEMVGLDLRDTSTRLLDAVRLASRIQGECRNGQADETELFRLACLIDDCSTWLAAAKRKLDAERSTGFREALSLAVDGEPMCNDTIPTGIAFNGGEA